MTNPVTSSAEKYTPSLWVPGDYIRLGAVLLFIVVLGGLLILSANAAMGILVLLVGSLVAWSVALIGIVALGVRVGLRNPREAVAASDLRPDVR